jgi:hypothetical protein
MERRDNPIGRVNCVDYAVAVLPTPINQLAKLGIL